MAEEQKSQKVVETYKAVAAGIASVVTAVFTSKLGVAGTLIGTALTATLITLISAALKVQLMKASDTISGLPSAVQGRSSTQQLRIPGRPNPEPNPVLAAGPKASGGRLSGLGPRLRAIPARLRALPGFLRELPAVQRRKMLLAGVLAGLVATVIGLSTVTGIELAGGNTLSCLVWTCAEDETASAKSSGHSGLSILGGRSLSSTQGTPSVDPSGGQPFAPQNGEQVPQQRQPTGQPAQPPGIDEGVLQQQQQPYETPRGADPAQQPDVESAPDEDGEAKSPPPDNRQSTPQRGESGYQQNGPKKEDRG
ncbi:MAG: hypothetical protein M3272_08075 [Actinomycetota bacterium]|nr:hypothetical protein [Actinomycetota bacterium]